MTGVLNVDTIADNAGTGPVTLTKQSAAKAYVHYDQANTTDDGSFNVSSVTDWETGEFNVNFTNSFDDAYHVMSGCSGFIRVSFTNRMDSSGTHDVNTTSVGYVSTAYANNAVGTPIDMHSNMAVFHGDLA